MHQRYSVACYGDGQRNQQAWRHTHRHRNPHVQVIRRFYHSMESVWELGPDTGKMDVKVKNKISITLTLDVLASVDKFAGSKHASAVIERAIRS